MSDEPPEVFTTRLPDIFSSGFPLPLSSDEIEVL